MSGYYLSPYKIGLIFLIKPNIHGLSSARQTEVSALGYLKMRWVSKIYNNVHAETLIS